MQLSQCRNREFPGLCPSTCRHNMSMHGIWTPLLFLLCFCPLLLSAAPGVAPPTSAGSQHVAPIVPATATAANSSSPNCTDLSATTGVLNWTCWDTLGMNQYMFNWNYTAEACKSGELWSTCFLRVAYGSDGYDCSRLGSLNCTAPRLGGPVKDAQIFYGAQNIYGEHRHRPHFCLQQNIPQNTNPASAPSQP